MKKPDARIFQIALEAIGVVAADAIFVGDHPELDIVGPAKVGMRTVWLENGRPWPKDKAEPDYRIAAFSEFDEVLAYFMGEHACDTSP